MFGVMSIPVWFCFYLRMTFNTRFSSVRDWSVPLFPFSPGWETKHLHEACLAIASSEIVCTVADGARQFLSVKSD
jgi:hypothetical protein